MTIKEEEIVNCSVLSILIRKCQSSKDKTKLHNFYLLKSSNWCNIIPITKDKKVVMVKQYRVGIDDTTLEIPGGVSDPSDPDIQASAVREMIEETGYTPLPDAKYIPLGWTFPNPAIQDNKCYSFALYPVKKTREQKLDPSEMIEVVEVPLNEIKTKILNGEINHALIINAFFFLTMQEKKTGPDLQI
ncbi:MAG: hypothetical protein A3K03_06800 [Bdellovibrionales bacterium RIFOXYD1_FULL_44_7]|nr:MAG: hypothetical protein A3K03_06800 [Bdellovibrionales bacterium RIFOXYD1_FULL_44_7]